MSISSLLKSRHAECDELFVAMESLCLQEKWDAGSVTLSNFQLTLEAHFDEEESVIFPAFEAASGMLSGPTAVMRLEHQQIRALVGQIESAISSKELNEFSGLGETLLILMQQHNLKEENILYPMFDRTLVASDVLVALNKKREVPCPT